MNDANGSNSEAVGPAIEPLRRLAVRDGLLLDAERWQIAHNYHRQRQNVHYQSLNLPGIVSGLEVASIPPPDRVPARYRDRRWLQVCSGIAIDARGNPIVLDRPVEFRIASVARDRPLTVYLVARYVDPETLQRSQPADIVAETFRINEKTEPPDSWEIELCRLTIPPGDVMLQPAADVFNPGFGELDSRYRQTARSRPQAIVRAAFLTTGLRQEDERTHRNLIALMEATNALYTPLYGDPDIAIVDLNPVGPEAETKFDLDRLDACDLLYLSHRHCLRLSAPAMTAIGRHLKRGGVILVELLTEDGNFEELDAIVRELTAAISDLQGSRQFTELREQLEAELSSLSSNLTSRLMTARQALLSQLAAGGIDDFALTEPDRDHPLRRHPFAFSGWPAIHSEPLRLFEGGGLAFAIGDLSLVWGADPDLSLSRERVRSAHEFGINLLHFAWQRHHWTLAQQLPVLLPDSG